MEKTHKNYNKIYREKYGFSYTQKLLFGFDKCLEVYSKFDFKCDICKLTERLAIHHIDFSGKLENPNNNTDNLRLLCVSCHQKEHRRIKVEEILIKYGLFKRKGREKEYGTEWKRNYRQNNADKVKEERRLWRLKNKDKIKIYEKRYRDKLLNKKKGAK
jgi:hypothetical protein